MADPLPSWRDGAAKRAILEFAAAAADPASPDFFSEEERVAVFDNDGTLWVEQPLYTQLSFALDELKALAPAHPEWAASSPALAAAADGDLGPLLAGGMGALMQLVAATHAGMTNDAFVGSVKEWIAGARHPRFGRAYTECVYQPMLEVMALLRARGFQVRWCGGVGGVFRKSGASSAGGSFLMIEHPSSQRPTTPTAAAVQVWIVSGGGVEFMRPWAQRVYGVPPERVIGSHTAMEFTMEDGVPTLTRQPKVGAAFTRTRCLRETAGGGYAPVR
jgi:hypothetical protein